MKQLTVIVYAFERSRRISTLTLKWSSWRKYTSIRRKHRRIISRCVEFHGRMLMESSMSAWREEVLCIARRIECVRSCIRSKRLLMTWWMSWYWDSHEPEIRLALTSLYGNCEDTMDQIFDSDKMPKGRSIFHEWQRKNPNESTLTEDMRTINHSVMSENSSEKQYDEDITSSFRKAFVQTFSSA